MENVIGYLQDGMAAWWREGLPVGEVPQITVQDLHRELDTLQLIDVRPTRRVGSRPCRARRFRSRCRALTRSLADVDRRAAPFAVHWPSPATAVR